MYRVRIWSVSYNNITYDVFECNFDVKLTDLSVVHPIYYRYDNLTRKGRNYKIYYYCRFNMCSMYL